MINNKSSHKQHAWLAKQRQKQILKTTRPKYLNKSEKQKKNEKLERELLILSEKDENGSLLWKKTQGGSIVCAWWFNKISFEHFYDTGEMIIINEEQIPYNVRYKKYEIYDIPW